MKNLFENFLERIEDQEITKIWLAHPGVKKKFFDFFYNDISIIKEPTIIEFGVRHGISTSLFLDVCNINNGNYMPPKDYGYSIEMKEESVNTFSFPNGKYCSNNL